jgi:hypothetical protein
LSSSMPRHQFHPSGNIWSILRHPSPSPASFIRSPDMKCGLRRVGGRHRRQNVARGWLSGFGEEAVQIAEDWLG